MKYNQHTAPIFKKFNLPNFETIRDCTALTHLREFIMGNLPKLYYTQNYLQYHTFKNRKPNQFTLPMPKFPINKYPQYIVPKQWNMLCIRDNDMANSKKAFNKKLKQKMINDYDTICYKAKCYSCGRS